MGYSMTIEQIYNTQKFIQQNYAQQLFVKDLEKISCYSYRNLQRVYKSVYGETIGAYQTRLKIENAYKKIIYTKMPISEIALDVGFADVQSLRKAFKKRFKYPPSEARNKKLELFEENDLTILTDEPLDPKITFIDEVNVFYQSIRTNYINMEIDELWDKIDACEFDDNSIEYFGLIVDDPIITESIHCRYDACITADPKNEVFPEKRIFGGKYATFIHRGSYDEIEKTYQKIYGSWVLQSDIELSELPIIEHYIKHTNNSEKEDEFETAILLPIL